MEYKITLYQNLLIKPHKTNIVHLDNKITQSKSIKTVDLLDDYEIINNYIYCGASFFGDKEDRSHCITNILTFDLSKDFNINNWYNKDDYLFWQVCEENNMKYLFYKTTNDNYRLLILLNKYVLSEEYKLLWEKYCIELELIKYINPTMKDISRLWFATKEFITGYIGYLI